MPALVLSKAHLRRLRHYFGKRHAGTVADNTDLDLVGAGLIERVQDDWSGCVLYRITPAGERALAAQLELERARRAPHDELAGRLAQWLQEQGRRTWENVELVAEVDAAKALVRPDVFSLACTYNEARIDPVVHEVKVSRADFLVDVSRPEKRAAYASISDRVIYVCQEGLIEPDEVPAECGLLLETAPGVFKLAKRAKKNRLRKPFTTALWMRLLLKGEAVPD